MKRDVGAEWLAFEQANDARDCVARAFGLADPEGEDVAAFLALIGIGVTAGFVVREPRFRHSAGKLARDAALGRPTLHGAPLWRHPITGEETGEAALILPVMRGPHVDEMLPLDRLAFEDDADFAAAIDDLIAIPLQSGRARSLTGHSLAVALRHPLGQLAEQDGKLIVFGSGMAWLDAHVAQARRIAVDTPAHLVEQLHLPFPVPTSLGAMLLEPRALEWRITRHDCAIPAGAREVVCPDSRRLAELIDMQMRKKEPVRKLPVVRGPAAKPEQRIAA